MADLGSDMHTNEGGEVHIKAIDPCSEIVAETNPNFDEIHSHNDDNDAGEGKVDEGINIDRNVEDNTTSPQPVLPTKNKKLRDCGLLLFLSMMKILQLMVMTLNQTIRSNQRVKWLRSQLERSHREKGKQRLTMLRAGIFILR